jgi:hypothetical protein
MITGSSEVVVSRRAKDAVAGKFGETNVLCSIDTNFSSGNPHRFQSRTVTMHR